METPSDVVRDSMHRSAIFASSLDAGSSRSKITLRMSFSGGGSNGHHFSNGGLLSARDEGGREGWGCKVCIGHLRPGWERFALGIVRHSLDA
jgi:hypothetical protein